MRQSTDLLNKINVVLPEINIDAKNIWWVGFSGGLDSTVLLHLLLSKNLPITISAIHINHQISPNADSWQKHCEEFCQLRGIQLICSLGFASTFGNVGQFREGRASHGSRHLTCTPIPQSSHSQTLAAIFFGRLTTHDRLKSKIYENQNRQHVPTWLQTCF